jgi:hypothetical protein
MFVAYVAYLGPHASYRRFAADLVDRERYGDEMITVVRYLLVRRSTK